MSIASRIQSIEEHIKESYQELEGIGIDTTGVNKNLENIPKLIDEYWETLPKVTEEGTSITLDNTKEGKMKIVLKGNTSQENTTGKNKLPILEYSGKTSNSMTTSCDGVDYTINGTLSSSWFDLNNWTNATIPAGRYLLSWESSIIPRLTFVAKYLDESIATFYISGGRNYVVVNLTQNVISYRLYSDGLTNGQAYNGTIKKLLLEAKESGEDRGDYEPYTNGASPNPDYPQQVQVVTGNNSITISNSDNTQSKTYPINLGSIELCKIGDYQDSIVKDNGKWYVNKQIGKVVLDGSEYWGYTAVAQGSLFRNGSLLSDAIIDDTYAPYCNYYKGIPRATMRANNNIICNIGSTFRYLDIVDSRYTNADDFKTWLGTHNPTLYYVLATPTYTEITDSTLISQLEAVKRSFNGQTNISQENDDNASILNASALENM